MKLLHKAPDGGATSGVTGYSLIEAKRLGTVVLLRFGPGTREAYHSHAFNAVTLWLRGRVTEHRIVSGEPIRQRRYRSGMLKLTRRHCLHQVESHGVSWALSIRGPWRPIWHEVRNGQRVTLTHGREVLA